jgi:hypothetical protein
MAEDRALARCLGLGALGVVLMFVAHFLGLLGWMLSEGKEMRPPYWWGYLILYPVAAAIATRVTSASWREAALCLCAPPVLYFVAHAVIDGEWHMSDDAALGSLLTLGVTALVAYYFRDRTPGVAPGATGTG